MQKSKLTRKVCKNVGIKHYCLEVRSHSELKLPWKASFLFIISKLHAQQVKFALDDCRSAHLSLSKNISSQQKTSAKQRKNTCIGSIDAQFDLSNLMFAPLDDREMDLFANNDSGDDDNDHRARDFPDSTSESEMDEFGDSEDLLNKHRGKEIYLPTDKRSALIHQLGGAAEIGRGIPMANALIDDFGGAFDFGLHEDDDGDVRMQHNDDDNFGMYGNDDFDDFGESEEDHHRRLPNKNNDNNEINEINKKTQSYASGNETDAEPPNKRRRRQYRFVNSEGEKLSSETITLWMKDRGPTMSVRRLPKHYIAKKRQRLNIEQSMMRPAMSATTNFNAPINVKWRAFMRYKPRVRLSSSSNVDLLNTSNESIEIGRNGSPETTNFHDGDEDGVKRKRTSLEGGEDDEQYGNDDFGDFDNDGFENGDFYNNGDKAGIASGTQEAAASLLGLGGHSDFIGSLGGLGGRGKPSGETFKLTATNEAELIALLVDHGMDTKDGVDFHQACFGCECDNIVGDDDNDDDDEVILPSRSEAAQFFCSLLLASNNFKISVVQDTAWGPIHVRARE